MAEEVLQNQQVINEKSLPHARAPAPVSERPFRAPGSAARPTGLPGRRASAARLRIVLQGDRKQSNDLYRFGTEILYGECR